ncbi:hypothetical protein B9G55_01820 [Saccharibacillus sp. O16]|nr:hypothetical protein B9G55_01820 [Saccharibacillus sp. O16]
MEMLPVKGMIPMKHRWSKWAAGLLAGSLFMAPVSHAAPPEDVPDVSLVLNGSTVQNGELELHDGHAYIPARKASELLGFFSQYEEASRTLTLLRPDVKLEMKLGDERAAIDGRTVKSEAAYAEEGQLYVPLRTLSTALKTRAGWNAAAASATLEDPGRYRMDSSGGQTAWVSFATGEVYSLEQGVPRKLQGADVSGLKWGTVEMRGLGEQAYLLTVEREYGASMQNVLNRYQFLVQKGALSRQAHFRYSGLYTSGDQAPLELPAQRAYLSDGQSIQVVGMGGRAAAEYDLEELTGQKGPFIVESVTADYLLVRPFDTLQPILIELRTGEAALLYKHLPEAAEIWAWDEVTHDVGEPLLLEARLRLVKQEGDQLLFRYKRIAPGADSGQEESWSYTLKQGK